MPATASDFLQYLDDAVKARRVNSAYKTSAQRVLEAAFGEAWRTVEVDAIDVDKATDAFAKTAGDRYTPVSINSYKSRFRKALQRYRDAYDPAGESRPRPSTAPTLVDYPVPLLSGRDVIASLRVPVDLTPAEAGRLVEFVAFLANTTVDVLCAARTPHSERETSR